MQFTIKQGMNQDILKNYPDDYFDSIVTDPPYGIEFLGKDWDKNTGAVETWQECLRVLKPGGHLLAFSAARTYHHLATNIESVGFEIRDQIMWIYGSGFPKAQDVGKNIQKRIGVEKTKPQKGLNAFNNKGKTAPKVAFNLEDAEYGNKKDDIITTSPEAQQWEGWKTALKPAHEPIVMARKPFKGSTIDNVLEHGVGALNIDATRIPTDDVIVCGAGTNNTFNKFNAENNIDGPGTGNKINPGQPKWQQDEQGRFPSNVLGEIPDYQKYFYCPKVSRAERHCGFEQKNIPTTSGGMYDNHGTGKMYSIGTDMKTTNNQTGSLGRMKDAYAKGSLDHIPTDSSGMFDNHYNGEGQGTYMATKKGSLDQREKIPGQHWGERQLGANDKVKGNNHPTVKPVELMKYLIKLVTPEGGRVLDPFNGSGSTGMAAVELGYEYTGCELDPNYVEIAERRIRGWYEKTRPDNNFGDLFATD
jgi:site-specific DNA-methyltransferase (adenine-specific)